MLGYVWHVQECLLFLLLTLPALLTTLHLQPKTSKSGGDEQQAQQQQQQAAAAARSPTPAPARSPSPPAPPASSPSPPPPPPTRSPSPASAARLALAAERAEELQDQARKLRAALDDVSQSLAAVRQARQVAQEQLESAAEAGLPLPQLTPEELEAAELRAVRAGWLGG